MFGVPQSCGRVWIMALPPHVAATLDMPWADIENMAARMMESLCITHVDELRDLDDFLCDDTHPAVVSHTSSGGGGHHQDRQRQNGKGQRRKLSWPEQHARLSLRTGHSQWWLSTHPSEETLTEYPGLRELSERELDVLATHRVQYPDVKGTVDVHQSGARCSVRSHCSHIVTPGSRLYLKHRCRLMSPIESLLLQGIHYGDQEVKIGGIWCPFFISHCHCMCLLYTVSSC